MSLLTGLVGLYKLDGNSNDSVGGNNGTDTAITYVSGRDGSAASGNATTSKIDLGVSAALNLTGDMTISAWHFLAAGGVTDNHYIATRVVGNGAASGTYSFYVAGFYGAVFATPAGTVTSAAFVGLGNGWHHIAATRSGTTVTIYVDGAKSNSASLAVGTSLPTQHTLLGSRDDGNTFIGKDGWILDEVAFYDRALSYSEIKEQWNVGRGRFHPYPSALTDSLEAYYPMESNVRDHAQHADLLGIADLRHDATLSGAAIDFVQGLNGLALRVYGAASVAQYSCPLTSAFTLSTWVKWTGVYDTSPYAAIIVRGAVYFGLWIHQGYYSWVSSGVEYHSNTLALTNTWQHVVVTYDGANYAITVDGVADGSGAATLNSDFTAENFLNWSNYYEFRGQMQHTALFSRVLSASEITELYNAGTPLTLGSAFGSSGPPPAPVAPSITNMVPAAGTPIYPTTALQFDVTDDSGLFTAVILMVSFADGSYEVVYDSSDFATKYRTSTISTITNGYQFVLRRNGGWPSAPTLKVVSVDQGGSENPQ